MPSYYQGIRDEYGNRDYARRDGYADRYYGHYDERGSAPPEWEGRMPEEEERAFRDRYDRRYPYPARDDYRYQSDYGGERGYGLDEYGRGPSGYGVERDWRPPDVPQREWQEPHYGPRAMRSGYGYWHEPYAPRREYDDRPSYDPNDFRYRQYREPYDPRRGR
jgi:hypothetical protein